MITNKDAICEGLKPSIKVSNCLAKLEVVSRGRKGHHSPKDWIKLEEERRRVDTGIGQQVSRSEKRVSSGIFLFKGIFLCTGVNGEDGSGIPTAEPSVF